MAWLPQNITHSNISQPSGVLECINIYISTLSYLSTVLRIIQAFSQCLSPSTLLKHALQGGWWLTYHSYSINTVEAPSSTLSLQISGKITIVGERNVVSTIFLLNPPLLFHTQTLILHRWFSLLKPAVFLIRLQFVHLRHLSFSSWIIITQPDNAVGHRSRCSSQLAGVHYSTDACPRELPRAVCVWKSPLRLTHPSFLAHPSSEQTCSVVLKLPVFCQFNALQAHFLPRSA